MPAKPKANVTIKAKREAIAKAYGCHPVEADMDDFYYNRRHLAKLPHANEHGWHELRYQDEGADLADAIEEALRGIRERDGVKYFKEVAGNLIKTIAGYVEYHAGPKALRREMNRTGVGVTT
jgi:hypothetical protein